MRTRLIPVTLTASVLLLVLISYTAGTRHLLAPVHSAADDTCQTFKETGHTVCGDFLAYWQAHGGVAQQGFPISDVFAEQSETDGKTYKVQYFERAVFEAHPENPPPYNVLLSLLGSQKYQAKYRGTPPVASGAAGSATVPPASSPTATVAVSSAVATVPNASSAITFLSVMGGMTGGEASVGIKGPPNTTCVLSFLTPAGTLSKASGLGSVTTTALGIATWTWKIEAEAGHGTGKVTVVCGNVSNSASIAIT